LAEQRSDGLDEFEAQRSRLFGIAYRMLGTVTDAEDILQDAWLRWQGTDCSGVAEPASFLARVVTNLCLNALDSARAKREVYVGPWLPEPIFTASTVAGSTEGLGPLDGAAQRDTVSFALLTVLERLSPPERAAYVLTEAFGYSNREVAELIGTSEANARQLRSRARGQVADGAAGASVCGTGCGHGRDLPGRKSWHVMARADLTTVPEWSDIHLAGP
jgi:RNA polymerase sigma factor (sigma-70 family)